MKGRLRHLRLAHLRPRGPAPFHARYLSSFPSRDNVANSKDPAVKPDHQLSYLFVTSTGPNAAALLAAITLVGGSLYWFRSNPSCEEAAGGRGAALNQTQQDTTPIKKDREVSTIDYTICHTHCLTARLAVLFRWSHFSDGHYITSHILEVA